MVRFLVYIKHHLGVIWTLIEWANTILFKWFYSKRLNRIISTIFEKNADSVISFRKLGKQDMVELESFFHKQPESAFLFFKPHGFSLEDLISKNKDQSFIMIGAYIGEKLVGYCFLRCFFNRQAFRGKIVDVNYQGRGIAKKMGMLTSKLCLELGFRLFATISKDNVKSIASSKAVNEIRVVKELPDNYMYVEYLLKKE